MRQCHLNNIHLYYYYYYYYYYCVNVRSNLTAYSALIRYPRSRAYWCVTPTPPTDPVDIEYGAVRVVRQTMYDFLLVRYCYYSLALSCTVFELFDVE